MKQIRGFVLSPVLDACFKHDLGVFAVGEEYDS
jgi:hypothetical protein